MANKTPENVATLGLAFAGFVISATILHSMVKRGVITASEARRRQEPPIIGRGIGTRDRVTTIAIGR